jgi:arylsulfatase B
MACGPNGRGQSERACVGGEWSATGPCIDEDVCEDTTLQAGSTPCGPNARGTLLQVCIDGQWQDGSTCEDGDVCVDTATGPGVRTCGQNGRGTLQVVCVSGQWQEDTTCLDPDVCSDTDTQTGTTNCGLNGRGAFDQVCTQGQWQDTALCVDPDECTDGTASPGTTSCGAGNQGTLEQLCVAGSFVDSLNCIIESRPPNILLIIADDVGAEASSIYPQALGSLGAAPMPNIEALANEGLTFDSAWANPVCSPTRGTIVSGLYGNRTGVLTPGDRLDPNVQTIYDYLSAAPQPYDIGVFGKWHLAGINNNDNQLDEVQHVLDTGVPFFEGFVGGLVEDYFDWPLVTSAGIETPMTEYATSVITDRVIAYITARETNAAETPWFAHVAYNGAHDPFQVPPSDLHGVDVGSLQPGDMNTSVAVYHAMIEAMDTEIGRLLGAVDLSKTLVIYLGDNGTPREVKDSTSPVRDSKISTYEGGIWVPMVMAGAGITRSGEREPSIVSAVDLYATIISQAGHDISQLNDSFDITPLFSDSAASTGRQYAFTEHCSTNSALGRHIAIRNQRYKLLRSRTTWGLFDLQNDRSEASNLYNDSSYANVRSELEGQLALIQANAAAGCF